MSVRMKKEKTNGNSDSGLPVDSGLSTRTVVFIVAVLFLVALAVRLAFWFELRNNDISVLLESETMDSFRYHSWAERIASGDFLLESEGLFTLSPFYSYLLAPIYFVFGSNMFTATLVQLILGAASVAAVYLAGSLAFNRTTGVLAAGLTTFYGQFVLIEGLLLSEAFLPVLTALFICSTAWALKKEKPGLFIVSGLLLGMLFSIRPQYFLVVLLLPLCGMLGAARAGKRKRMMKILAFGAVGAALAVAPLAIRNFAATGKPALLTTAGGVNFYIGNNKQATGTWMIPHGFRTTQSGMFEDFAKAAEAADAAESTGAAEAAGATGAVEYGGRHSRYWFFEGLEHIAADPARWTRLMVKKAALFWNNYELPVNFDFAFFREILTSPRFAFLNFAAIGSLGIAGLFLAIRARRKPASGKTSGRGKTGWLILILAGLFGGTILFFLSARYRVAAVPYIVLFAAHALERGIAFFKQREWGSLMRCALPLAPALVLVLWSFPVRVPPAFTANQCRYIAHYFARQGKWPKTERWTRKALEETPRDPLLWMDLARLYHETGRPAEAEAALKRSRELASPGKAPSPPGR